MDVEVVSAQGHFEGFFEVVGVKKPGGQGLMNSLLEDAVAHARAHGAEVVEGYPIESDSPGRGDTISGYVGITRLLERAGFERVAETTAHSGGRVRWIVRRELGLPQPTGDMQRSGA